MLPAPSLNKVRDGFLFSFPHLPISPPSLSFWPLSCTLPTLLASWSSHPMLPTCSIGLATLCSIHLAGLAALCSLALPPPMNLCYFPLLMGHTLWGSCLLPQPSSQGHSHHSPNSVCYSSNSSHSSYNALESLSKVSEVFWSIVRTAHAIWRMTGAMGPAEAAGGLGLYFSPCTLVLRR